MMSFYELFLCFLFVVKITFALSLFMHKFKPNALNTRVMEISDNIFVFFMSLLMVYLFHPRGAKTVLIDYHTKLFLFAFGVLQLLHLYRN